MGQGSRRFPQKPVTGGFAHCYEIKYDMSLFQNRPARSSGSVEQPWSLLRFAHKIMARGDYPVKIPFVCVPCRGMKRYIG
jgi:hypothetical protein